MANETDTRDAADGGVALPLEKLTRAQVFARDPEEMTPANLEQVIEEISKINVRNRKARADDAAIAEAATKMKKANASRKKKPAPSAAPDILDTVL
jgi:hypothetical protein